MRMIALLFIVFQPENIMLQNKAIHIVLETFMNCSVKGLKVSVGSA